MATNVILPHMGLTTAEGTVAQWLKREGDEVTKGEPLVEALTDKVNTQVEGWWRPQEEVPEMSLEGRIVLVTGAGRGIGRAIAMPSQEGCSGASAPDPVLDSKCRVS